MTWQHTHFWRAHCCIDVVENVVAYRLKLLEGTNPSPRDLLLADKCEAFVGVVLYLIPHMANYYDTSAHQYLEGWGQYSTPVSSEEFLTFLKVLAQTS
jgi:hypothetical protein